jgi:hypothetical protein
MPENLEDDLNDEAVFVDDAPRIRYNLSDLLIPMKGQGISPR